MPWLPKVLSVVPISAAIILLAASSSGCGEDCVESGTFRSVPCGEFDCCDSDARQAPSVTLGFQGCVCLSPRVGSNRGFRLTSP